MTPLMAADIYDAVEALTFDPTGYFATERDLNTIFNENEIKTVIELGSWAGACTRFLGHRVGEGGVVYAIDHWKGSQNFQPEKKDPRLDHIFHLFLSNIRYAGLSDRVVPIRMTTREASKALAITADLIYIDASRDAEGVYHDIIDWASHLNERGIICGAEWREPAIQQGVKKAALKLGYGIETDKKGYFWRLK